MLPVRDEGLGEWEGEREAEEVGVGAVIIRSTAWSEAGRAQ